MEEMWMGVPEPGVLAEVFAEGEGGGDAAAVLDTPGAEGGDGGELPGQEIPGEGEGNEPTEKPGEDAEQKADGRNNPDAIRKHLAALKANPETAALGKQITDKLGKARGYEEVYPTVREAREVKALIDSIGGREQVTAAIESRAQLQRVDSLVEAGDPAVLDDIFKMAPEGAAKIVLAGLDRVAKENPEAYHKAIAPHVLSKLNMDGMPGALNALVDAFNTDNKAAMQDMIGRLLNYYKGLMGGAKPAAVDPERSKFEEEKAKFAQERETEAIQKTFTSNLTYSGQKIDEGLKDDIKRLGLGPKAVEKLRQEVWKTIEAKRQADKTFMATISTKFPKGKSPAADAVATLNGFTDRTYKEAIDEVVTTYYGDRKAAPKAGTKVDPTAPKKPAAAAGAAKPGAAVAAGWTRVNEAPDRQTIDYDHKDTDVFKGRAVLKGGKRVQWR